MLVEREGHLAHLILNRPEVLNAIDNRLATELGQRADELARDPETWVIILRGAGERAFSAGADLKARRDMTPEQWGAQRQLFRGMFEQLRGRAAADDRRGPRLRAGRRHRAGHAGRHDRGRR